MDQTNQFTAHAVSLPHTLQASFVLPSLYVAQYAEWKRRQRTGRMEARGGTALLRESERMLLRPTPAPSLCLPHRCVGIVSSLALVAMVGVRLNE